MKYTRCYEQDAASISLSLSMGDTGVCMELMDTEWKGIVLWQTNELFLIILIIIFEFEVWSVGVWVWTVILRSQQSYIPCTQRDNTFIDTWHFC